MRIQMVHHRVACFRLGPIALAERTSKTNQEISAETQSDNHIAVRIRGFGEEGHGSIYSWAQMTGFRCHPAPCLMRVHSRQDPSKRRANPSLM